MNWNTIKHAVSLYWPYVAGPFVVGFVVGVVSF